MQVLVTGATGNVGTSVLDTLSRDPDVERIVGVARRASGPPWPKVEWHSLDVSTEDLAPLAKGVDAVIHLAWLLQPARNQALVRRVNLEGSRRVLEAVASASVKTLIYASSVGGYAPGPKECYVDESWPYTGVSSSYYSRQKAAVEAMLDGFEQAIPEVRVVRLRPGLIFKAPAAASIARYFLGKILPLALIRPRLVPALPFDPLLVTQVVHSHDVAEAYRKALFSDVSGPFNLAADPVVDAKLVASLLDATTFSVTPSLLRSAAKLAWHAHLIPASPGWVDMGHRTPLMDTSRAQRELGWRPTVSAGDTVAELLDGVRKRAGADTPVLMSKSGPLLELRVPHQPGKERQHASSDLAG
jgi:UDP-glucose 4-epimerase